MLLERILNKIILYTLLLAVYFSISTKAQRSISTLTLYLGGSATAVTEIENSNPAVSGLFIFGLGFNYFDAGGDYTGVGLEMNLSYDWSGFAGEIDVGFGSGDISGSSFSTFFFGVRSGYGSGTFYKEELVQGWGGTFEVSNEFSAVPIQLVLGYRTLGIAGFSIDLAPGVLYVTEQDPEIEEAKIDTALLLLELRLRVSVPYTAIE